ncbi:hypothetical protein SAMN05216452_3194 [Nitratireductor aquibiodomus]|uniref:Uncharacterized protein n=1 Tax=Nitratireductor aquibiodomus TaxID=204799 RepID=A0A1H4M824_9HYPH|nr:hypothetical protein [Nitratireductor aquibiodomus]SEB79231.1 hypothetical protein SAMN05216452_3194 [Nitratireductor aquibiodomus]
MNGLWAWITENFNNRELAGAIWLTAAIAVAAIRSEVRESVRSILKALLDSKLLVLFSALAANVAAISWLAASLKFWNFGLIVPTIVWYFFGALPLLARSFDAKEGSQHFRGYAKDALSGTIFLEFIFVAGTFSLPVELFLTPIVAVIAMMLVISERKPEHAKINTLLTWVMAGIAILVLWNSVSEIAAHPETFFTASTFKSFILPVYLTIASIPFFYLTHCYSHAESASIQISRKTFQSDELKAYARKRFFSCFFLRPWLLRRAIRQFHSLPAETTNDVDQIIRDIRKHEKETQNPPEVDESQGWSPYKAREFLANVGLRTGDYHTGYGGEEWWASSLPMDLDEQLLPNTVSFYVEGVKGLATILKLKGHFLDEFSPEVAVEKFGKICSALLEKTVPSLKEQLQHKLIVCEEFTHSTSVSRVTLQKDRFPSEKGFNLTFQISKKPTIL